MSDYFVGELRMFPYTKIPEGWALCDGRSMTIQTNAALFALIGTTYGGDGKTTFNLPDLRGRAVMGYSIAQATSFPFGKPFGVETVTLTSDQALYAHTHSVRVVNNSVANANGASNNFMAQINTTGGGMSANTYYAPPTAPLVTLSPQTIGSSGGGQPHNNMQPFLALNICIALTGIFPQRT